LRLVSARWALTLLLITAWSASVPAAELTFDIKIERGRVPDTKQLIRVNEGDVVKLRWTSDQPLILHLHGYDIEKRIAAGAVTVLAWPTRPGDFRSMSMRKGQSSEVMRTRTHRWPSSRSIRGSRVAGRKCHDTPWCRERCWDAVADRTSCRLPARGQG